MHVSAAELEITVKTAVIGAGAPPGIGDEIGKAALTLYHQNVDPSPIVALALENLEGHDAGLFHQKKAIHGRFVPTTSQISAILAGPSICDLIALGRGTVFAQSLDSPLLAIALIAARFLNAEIHNTAGSLQSVRCEDGKFNIVKEEIESWHNTADVTFCLRSKRRTARQTQMHGAIEADDVCWRRIVTIADKCLVSNSEASRLNDAGAGLIDGD